MPGFIRMPYLQVRFKTLGLGLCALVAVICIMVFIGWIFEIEILKSISPNYVTMKANTSVGLFSLSVAFALFLTKNPFYIRVGKGFSLVAGLIGLITLLEYAFDLKLGLDELLFYDLSAQGRFPPGRLAPITALSFIFLNAAALCINTSSKRLRLIRQLFAIITAVIAFQALIGYACGISFSFGKAYYTQMAVHTAFCFLCLSIAYLIQCRNEGLMYFISQKNAAGKSARTMFFSAILIPPIVTLIQIKGRDTGLYEADFGLLLQIITNMALFIFIVWHDSLEQTRNHEELESTKLSLELAEDAAQVGIWNFDIERRVVVGTLFHDQLYGRTEKVKEWTVEDIIASIHPEDRAVFTERTAAGLRDVGLSYAMEYRVIWPDSSVHWHSVMVRLKRDETGKVTHQRGITYDVTYVHETKLERELMEIREKAAVESLRLKSEFLATMSHEIRTPINGVMGMTNILLDTSLSAEQTEYAQAIKRSGQSLLVVINDILDFSKIEANKLDFEEIDFAVQQALEDAVLTVRYVAQKKNVQVNLFIDSAIPKLVAGDPGRLQQVVTNLLSNAVKFTPEGEVKVNARLLKCDEEFATVRIEVVDTGIGISESSLERLFQPFTQADNSTTRKYGGTGLGLSISKHLIERMHGEVGAASKVGEGSTFWFTARFGRATSGNELVSVKPEELIAATIPRCRILIAEDVLVNQIVAVRMVEKLGHFTHTVANGKEVLDALHNGDYDLILMDCHMPEMDGYEATTAIRASKTISNPNIIILAMTANAMKGDKEKCIAVGMNDYLSKPIEPKGLQKALSKWLLESGRSKKPA